VFTERRQPPVRASLPEPFEGTLPGSPLALVACQVRYADPAERVSASRVMDMLEGLRLHEYGYARTEQMRVQTVSINPVDPTLTTVEGTAWRLTSEDGRWVATIAADSYTLETTSYRTWKGDFRTRLEALVQTVESAVKPAVATRVGLRYVDSLRLGPEPDGYKKMISETLLGPLLHPLFGPGVTSTQQQFSFALDESLRVTIRHGLFPDPARAEASTYLLDTDIYREDLMRLDRAALLRVIDVMHDDHLRVFRACLTDAALAHLRGSVW
jgi:uncharacterized protein (TIGR04255 family)